MAEAFPVPENRSEEPNDSSDQVPPEIFPEIPPEPPPPVEPTQPEAGAAEPFYPPPAAGQPAPDFVEQPSTAPHPAVEPPEAQTLSPSDERTWAMLAHLSVLLNLVTGFLGPVAALIIYLIYKDRSRYVGYHAMQSFVFQMIWWVGGVALITLLWIVVGGLSALLIGLLCIPFAILATIGFALLPLGALVYGVIGAIQVSQGQNFRYWLVGDWVRGTLTGI